MPRQAHGPRQARYGCSSAVLDHPPSHARPAGEATAMASLSWAYSHGLAPSATISMRRELRLTSLWPR